MLRTPSELAALPAEKLTELQLAVLVRLGAVDPPICLGRLDAADTFLFDAGHERQVLAVLGVAATPANNGDADTYYSAGARRILKWRPGEVNDVGRSIADQDLEDFVDTRLGRLRRWWRWATSFRLFRVRLSGADQAGLHAVTAIGSIQAIASLLVILIPRISQLDGSDQDRCLSAYVDHSESIGWGIFASELALADAIIETDSELKDLDARAAIDRIASVEARYTELVQGVQAYLRDHDPEELLIKSVAGRLVAGSVRDVVTRAYSRAEREFADSLPKQLRDVFAPKSKSV